MSLLGDGWMYADVYEHGGVRIGKYIRKERQEQL
jgi:hypothetical protein